MSKMGNFTLFGRTILRCFLIFVLNMILSIAETKCGFSSNNRTSSPVHLVRVVGGTISKLGDWPWVVSLVVYYPDGLSLCAGSILSEKYILSAGHCTVDIYGHNTSSYAIVNVGTIDDEIGKSYKIKSMIAHPEFHLDPDAPENDIALFEVEESIKFDKNVGPICLLCNFQETHLELSTAMGFGKIHDKNGEPIGNNQLYDAEIPLQAPEHCGSTLFHNNETEICAGGFQKGTEEGDSGGPLVIYRTNSCSGSQQGTWYLIGITSTGEYELNNGEKNGTKGYDHGVYTRVSAYHDWIKEATKGEVTCCGKS